MNSTTPTLEEVRALNGRIYAMLDDREREVMLFYKRQGRKFGVTIEVTGEADLNAVAEARSIAEIDAILKKTNGTVSVAIYSPFSFRAEAQCDFDEFVRAAISAGIKLSIREVIPDDANGGLRVDLISACTLEQLRDVMHGVDSGHVMLQTLRPIPLRENSLERDYDLQ